MPRVVSAARLSPSSPLALACAALAFFALNVAVRWPGAANPDSDL